jgi:hypothetical protein
VTKEARIVAEIAISAADTGEWAKIAIYTHEPRVQITEI